LPDTKGTGQIEHHSFSIGLFPRLVQGVAQRHHSHGRSHHAELHHPKTGEKSRGATIKVEFVIDSVGRADMATFRPLRPAPTDYLRSVWEFVQSSKFTPARIGTRAVAQCGLQSFDFRSDYNDRSR